MVLTTTKVRAIVREELAKQLETSFPINDDMRLKVREGMEQVERGEVIPGDQLEKEFGVDLS